MYERPNSLFAMNIFFSCSWAALHKRASLADRLGLIANLVCIVARMYGDIDISIYINRTLH